MSRLAVASGAAAAALLFGLESAEACSCVRLDARQGLSEADAAFVGTLVARRQALPPRPGGVSSSADPDIFTFRVDKAIKGDLGQEIEVWSARSGASCGLEVAIGQQIGLLLRRDGTRWSSGLCWQTSPDALREAARPLPEPNGRGPVRFLVGGGFGGVRLLALDARGRTLGYGPGSGSTRLLSVCPRGRRAVEVVRGVTERVAVRDVRTLLIIRELALPAGSSVTNVFCRDRQARDVYVLARRGPGPGSAMLQVRAGVVREIYAGSAQSAAFQRNVAYLNEGDGGREIVRLDLTTGARRLLTKAPLGMNHLAVNPSGTRIAGVHSEGVRVSAPPPPPDRLVLLRLDRGVPAVRSVSLNAPYFSGELAWVDETRLAVFSHARVARVFDSRLRGLGRVRGWEAADTIIHSGVAYGLGRPSNRFGTASLQTATLPKGAARRVREFPGVPAAIAAVPGGVSLRTARGTFCLALERVFPPLGM